MAILQGPWGQVRQLKTGLAKSQPASFRKSQRLLDVVSRAQRKRQTEPEYAELDDDYSRGPSFNLDNLPKTSGYIFSTLQSFTDRFVDLAYDIAPEGVSRSVVETTTKGALVLVTLAFASSILSFLLNAGFVVLGLYIAAKVFNIDIGRGIRRGDDSELPPPRRGNSASDSRQKQQKSRWGSRDRQDNPDVSDVWFERPRKRSQD